MAPALDAPPGRRRADVVVTVVLLAVRGPLALVVCWVVALVVSSRRLARQRSAWWVPLVAVVAWFDLALGGSAVATSVMRS